MYNVQHNFTDEGKTKLLELQHVIAGDDNWHVMIDGYYFGCLVYTFGKWRVYNERFTTDDTDFMGELLENAHPEKVAEYVKRCDQRDKIIRENSEFLRQFRKQNS